MAFRKTSNGTEITQVRLKSLASATKFVGAGKGQETAVVGVGPSPCCCHCCIQIPSGFHLIFTKWDAVWETEDGNPYRKEGFVCCWPWYYRVSHVVTSVRRNAPVTNCPTRDNVLISVDISFNFQIIDAHTVRTMGAGRFRNATGRDRGSNTYFSVHEGREHHTRHNCGHLPFVARSGCTKP